MQYRQVVFPSIFAGSRRPQCVITKCHISCSNCTILEPGVPASKLPNRGNRLLEHPFRTSYNTLKELPKKPTLKHLQELLEHLEWFGGFGDFDPVLANIPPLKIKHDDSMQKALEFLENMKTGAENFSKQRSLYLLPKKNGAE